MFGAGEVVAGYTIDEFLGSGSSAEVYRVHRDSSDDPIALKVLHTRPNDRQRVRERFEREFSIAARLHHRHIVGMYARGEIDADTVGRENRSDATVLWMAMEFIAGTSAMELIPERGAEPDTATVVEIGGQIAAALDYAHSCDVLHRDVKPANIMVGRNGIGSRSVLTDFGIAQLLDDARPLARNGRVQGSIAYAAPELLTAQRLSPATDLYALAASMFELLTGEPPFPRATAFAITYAHIHDPLPKLTRMRPWLPSALNSVFARALAKNPGERYETCTEFTEIVRRALRDVPTPDAPPRRRLWRRRHVV
ncbi:serine/threonine-protein kinase [Gordonia sp. OPL2]|uniref:serine/threonine-protein kinase n=1 Tax=Gordonia sp. OPL2 TaxID=2486274 RepID=UPI001655838F|nr:serine/threonine-protein kinase [Gordonia sp. OPL2]ROZ86298.1 serine/threonine protein kinase [Gordonia sp. OPL2]